MDSGQEAADQRGNRVECRLEQEVAAVEKMDLGIGQVIGERLCACRSEDLVAASPYREQRHAAGPEILMDSWVLRRVGGIVAKQFELHVVIAGSRYQRVVMAPRFRIDQSLVWHSGDVLPAGGVQGEELPYRAFGLDRLLGRIGTHRLPEALNEAGIVGVTALADDRCDRGRIV